MVKSFFSPASRQHKGVAMSAVQSDWGRGNVCFWCSAVHYTSAYVSEVPAKKPQSRDLIIVCTQADASLQVCPKKSFQSALNRTEREYVVD